MKCYLFIKYKVRDYSNWRIEFESECVKEWRRSQGERHCQVFRDVDDENKITLLCEWESIDSAKKFFSNPELSDNMQISGVMEQPITYILKKD